MYLCNLSNVHLSIHWISTMTNEYIEQHQRSLTLRQIFFTLGPVVIIQQSTLKLHKLWSFKIQKFFIVDNDTKRLQLNHYSDYRKRLWLVYQKKSWNFTTLFDIIFNGFRWIDNNSTTIFFSQKRWPLNDAPNKIKNNASEIYSWWNIVYWKLIFKVFLSFWIDF